MHRLRTDLPQSVAIGRTYFYFRYGRLTVFDARDLYDRFMCMARGLSAADLDDVSSLMSVHQRTVAFEARPTRSCSSPSYPRLDPSGSKEEWLEDMRNTIERARQEDIQSKADRERAEVGKRKLASLGISVQKSDKLLNDGRYRQGVENMCAALVEHSLSPRDGKGLGGYPSSCPAATTRS